MGSAFRPEVDLWPLHSQQGCLTLRQSCTMAFFSSVSLSKGFKQSYPSDRWTKLNWASIQQAGFSSANSPAHVINVRLVFKRGVLHRSVRSCVSFRSEGFLSKSPSKRWPHSKVCEAEGIYVCVVLACVRIERLKWIPIRSPRTVKHTLSIWFSLPLHLHLAHLVWASRLRLALFSFSQALL